MAIYSIKDLEKLSGIKAHTIRIWEQRYKLLEPKRTDTNIRYYMDKDLRFLLNVALLKKNGLKISTIASMDAVDISKRVEEFSEAKLDKDTQLDALTIAMIEMNEVKFNKIISANIDELGMERTMLHVIHPFLDKLGVLWLTGSVSPVQEGFVSYLIRQKLIVAIDALPYPPQSAKRFMIYIPEGEMHELSILFMHFILKSRGLGVIYLGQNVSVDDLGVAIGIQRPDFVFSMISKPFRKIPVEEYIQGLASSHPEIEWLFTGFQVASAQIESQSNCTILTGLHDTLDYLKSV